MPQVHMEFGYIEKMNHWLVLVWRNGMVVTMVIRKSEEECITWMVKNKPIFDTGKVPQIS